MVPLDGTARVEPGGGSPDPATLRSLAAGPRPSSQGTSEIREVRPERRPAQSDTVFSGDAAAQIQAPAVAAIPAPLVNFEGLSNQDNFDIFGFQVNPPDPNGEVGLNHYVEMANLVFAVYSKTGNLLLVPFDTGTLWSGFAIPDCTDSSGDPIVLYDQFADRCSSRSSRRLASMIRRSPS